MSLTIFSSSCASNKALFAGAKVEKVKADASVRIVEVAKKLPNQPKECGQPERSGVVLGDRLDVALVKTNNALGRSNNKGARCAGWFNKLKSGYSK